MKKLLIVTNYKDTSLDLFFTDKIKAQLEVHSCLFEDDSTKIKADLLKNNYDFIYFRYPFRDSKGPWNLEELKQKIEMILELSPQAYFVDKVKNFNDIMLEDKWEQFKLCKAIMPLTRIPKDETDFQPGKEILKKRISGRAEGIFFDIKDVNEPLSEFVVQQKLEIITEYRVYVVFGEIIRLAVLRHSKTEDSKIKVFDSQLISEDLYNFVEKTNESCDFDLVGLDVAETKEGFSLIEFNKGCLFTKYFELTKINLAEKFVEKLLKQL